MRRRIRMIQMRRWRTPNNLLALLEKKGIKGLQKNFYDLLEEFNLSKGSFSYGFRMV